MLPIRTIVASPFPLREDLGNIEELIRSVGRRGVLEPIIVRPFKSKFEIVAGQRRYTACRINRLAEIPAIVLDLSDKEALEISLEENLHRKTLDPIEEAKAFKFYVDKYGYGSITELGERIGKSEEYVSHRILLLTLPENIQTLVRRRLLSSSDAWEITRLKDHDAEEKLATVALKNRLTVRELRQAANLMKEGMSVNNTLQKLRADWTGFLSPLQESSELRDLKVKKAAVTILRVALIKIDDLISHLDGDKVIKKDELVNVRLALHELIGRVGARRKGKSDDIQEIVKFIQEKFLRSINLRDLFGFSAIRSKQGFSMFDDFPPLNLMDLRMALVHMAKIWRMIGDSHCYIENVRVMRSGNLAIALFLYHYNIKVRGHPFSAMSRVTLVLEREDEEWEILHEHWSQADYNRSSFDKLKKFESEYEHTDLRAIDKEARLTMSRLQ